MDPITLAALITGGAALGAPVVAYFAGRFSRAKDGNVKYSACVVLAGLSNSGKSTFIEAFIPGVSAHAGVSTERVIIYQESREVPGESGTYLSDVLG